MNLDELRTIQSKERQKDSLQNLRPSFYQEVGEYIASLEAERDRVAQEATDPFSSPEVGRLTDEIETAKDVVEAIYERRMGKLVKQASLSAAGMPADGEGLTAEESDLFDHLVERIRTNKSRVLDVLEGVDAPSPSSAGGVQGEPAPDAAPDGSATQPTAPGEADSESGVSAADVMGSGVSPADEPAAAEETPPPPPDDPALERDAAEESAPDSQVTEPDPSPSSTGDGESGIDRLTVRITRDVGSILGIDDREYTLANDDVVTLPEQNAAPLVERDAAEPLE